MVCRAKGQLLASNSAARIFTVDRGQCQGSGRLRKKTSPFLPGWDGHLDLVLVRRLIYQMNIDGAESSPAVAVAVALESCAMSAPRMGLLPSFSGHLRGMKWRQGQDIQILLRLARRPMIRRDIDKLPCMSRATSDLWTTRTSPELVPPRRIAGLGSRCDAVRNAIFDPTSMCK